MERIYKSSRSQMSDHRGRMVDSMDELLGELDEQELGQAIEQYSESLDD